MVITLAAAACLAVLSVEEHPNMTEQKGTHACVGEHGA
jgi:hypothetical protein